MLIIVPVFTQNDTVRIQINTTTDTLSVFFISRNAGRVLYVLNDGLESQIFFYIRLYKKAEGFFAFLGDHLVAEYSPQCVGYRDFFDDDYVIENYDGKILRFKNPDKFVKELFSLRDFRLRGMEEADHSGYYVMVMVQLDSVKLVPPFTILSLLPFEGRSVTPWIKQELVK